MKIPKGSLMLISCALLSCAQDAGSRKDPSIPAPRKSLSQRLDESNGYAQDSDGNWAPRADKRSSFENQGESPYFRGGYDKKSYKTGDYRKKSWWGNKEYGRPAYAGDTDGSRFQKSSRLDGQGARESGQDARLSRPYQTDSFATGSAREVGRSPINRPSDAETDVRRRVYEAPPVIDWREQRSLTLEQSKGILGR